VSICPSCGHENQPGAKFCSECAAALVEIEEARREERKTVTVLFADLVGFTSRAEQMDPEDVRALLEPYHAKLRSELERFGGRVEKFIGDAVMALFGAPAAHEDDPERAVRAALAIRDWVREQEEDLQLRIAVNTGEVLVSLSARPERGEAMASGDAVNTTARLQSAAPVNGILVGETTYRATKDAIDYVEVEPVEAKGKSKPIPVWEVVAAWARLGTDVVRDVRTPLVGRSRELAALRNALERAGEERSPQLVTLVGEPGIGKSRLVYELRETIEHGGVPTYWRQGRSLPYGEGVTFWALAEMVKAQAGILETDSPEQAGSRLEEAVRLLLPDPREAQRVATHLRPLVGLAGEEGLGDDRRNESFAAWRRFFEAMAEQRPLVLVFEDLHWADDNLLAFIDHLVDWATGVPLLVVCTTRPELLDRRAGWSAGGRNNVTIALAPLTDDEIAALVAALLERPVMPADTQQMVLARAGGNPLYAEQYVRMLDERGEHEELPLPETVQGLIAARLDGLAAEDKALLQDAAVIGKVFWTGAVAALDSREPHAADERLHALERKEFVQRARRSSVSDETEYSFRHLLVRDVAYGQIPRAARGEKHRRAAEWIASLGRPEDHAEMLAHHYSSALEYARAAGNETSGVSEEARAALRTAGDRAVALSAFAEAARYYEAALRLWPPDDPERPGLLLARAKALFRADAGEEAILAEARDALIAANEPAAAAEAEILIADLYWRRGERARAEPHVERTTALVAEAERSRSKAYVLGQIARLLMLAGERRAIEVGTEAAQMAADLGLEEIEAHALCSVGASRSEIGDRKADRDFERSVEISQRIDSPELSRAYTCLADTAGNKGDLRRRYEWILASGESAERFGDAHSLRHLRGMVVQDHYWAGRWDEALVTADEAIAELESEARYFALIEGYVVRGRIRLARDDVDGALADGNDALELARESQGPQTLYPVLAFCAWAASSGNRASDAAELAEELINLRQASAGWFPRASSVELAYALAELGRPQLLLTTPMHTTTPWLEGAKAYLAGDFERAAEIYAGIGTKPDEAYARLRAAGALVEQGRRREADEQLAQALAFLRSVGATRYVREGEALLAASA
jgi:class 3 adenylate cyclase